DRLGNVIEIADREPSGGLSQPRALEGVIVVYVRRHLPRPAAADAAEPALHIENEGFALLHAVVDDVYPGFDLPGHDRADRLLAGRRDTGFVHLLAAHAHGI